MTFQTITWLPLILYFFKKTVDTEELRYALLTGVAVAVQILAGYPEVAFISQMALSVFALLYVLSLREARSYRAFGKKIFFLLPAFAAGYLLPALQLLPTWELATVSTRSGGVSLDIAGILSLDGTTFLTFLVMPSSYHAVTDAYPFAVGNFVSVLFILVGFTLFWPKTQRAFLVFWTLLALSLFISFGRHNFVFPLLYKLPGFHLFRNPRAWSMISILCVSILTGAGIDVIHSTSRKAVRLYQWACMISFLLLLICLASALGISIMRGDRTIARGILAWSGWSGLLLGLLLLKNRIKKTFIQPSWVIFVMLSLDMVFFSRSFVTSSRLPFNLVSEIHVLNHLLPLSREPFRLMALRQVRPAPNEGLLFETQTVDGYDPLIIRRFAELDTRALSPTTYPLDDLHRIRLENYSSRLADLLNVRYVLSPYDLPEPKLVLRHRSAAVRLYENTAALPRAFLVDRVVVKAPDAVLPYLASPAFDPAREAVVQEEDRDALQRQGLLAPPRTSSSAARPAPVRVLAYRPNAVALAVLTSRPALLVLSDVYYPGWQLEVDGQRQPIYQVNYCFRGVALPPGQHTVTFSYRPRSFRIGLAVSLLGLLLVLGGFIVRKRYGSLGPFRRNHHDL